MVSRYTTLVPSLGLHFGPACEAGLSAACEGSVCRPKEEGRKERVETIYCFFRCVVLHKFGLFSVDIVTSVLCRHYWSYITYNFLKVSDKKVYENRELKTTRSNFRPLSRIAHLEIWVTGRSRSLEIHHLTDHVRVSIHLPL